MTSGTARFQLFGSHWDVRAGHSLVLELAATDAPFLRPSNFAFTIEVHPVVVEVPFVD